MLSEKLMKRNIEKVHNHLGELAGLANKTEAAEKRILLAAVKRLDVVQAEIDRLFPGIETADDSRQDKYIAMITERGQLNTVIAKAKANLG
jgi:hypothetical protein